MSRPRVDPELARLADRLGVMRSYVDADDRPQQCSAAAVQGVVDVLVGPEPGAGASPGDADAPRPFDDVVLVRGGRLRSGVSPSALGPGDAVRVDVEHDDGGEAVVYEGPGTGISATAAWSDQPIGIHRLHWRAGGREGTSTLLVAPQRFDLPERSTPGLALFAPVYSLWTSGEPLPAYDSLATLGAAARQLGVDTVATLPLYAPGLGSRFDSSPYSPLSRFHWNELFVPDRLLGPVGDRSPEAPPVRGGTGRVDWAAVVATRTRQLADAAASMDDTERAALDRFEGEHPDIASYATFAAGGDPGLERLHLVGQWLAERAVTGATDELRAGGQRLALDLPVGTRGDSWETWRWPELFVRGAQIGAPPDTFFRAGQNWGLPPLNPVASRRDGHRVWHDLLVVACRHAGVLRIDHVMQVHRLWWIPEGHAADDGAYVHYPADELLAVAAIVAHRTGTLMVGEDLGTVPKAVSRLLADWGLIGMHEEDFTVHWWADDEPPARFESVPARTWAGIRTHDMAPLARMVEEVDTTPYRAQLGATIGRDVSADPFELAVAMTERLRSSDAYEVVLDIDDLLGVRDAHNVPGTVGPDNWSRRHVAPIEDLIAEPRIERLLCTTATNDDREGTP